MLGDDGGHEGFFVGSRPEMGWLQAWTAFVEESDDGAAVAQTSSSAVSEESSSDSSSSEAVGSLWPVRWS
jgi:hypothetical protein